MAWDSNFIVFEKVGVDVDDVIKKLESILGLPCIQFNFNLFKFKTQWSEFSVDIISLQTPISSVYLWFPTSNPG